MTESGGQPEAAPAMEESLAAARYHFDEGDLEAAEAWWRYAAELDPDDPRPPEGLAFLRERVAADAMGQELFALLDEPQTAATQTPPGDFCDVADPEALTPGYLDAAAQTFEERYGLASVRPPPDTTGRFQAALAEGLRLRQGGAPEEALPPLDLKVPSSAPPKVRELSEPPTETELVAPLPSQLAAEPHNPGWQDALDPEAEDPFADDGANSTELDSMLDAFVMDAPEVVALPFEGPIAFDTPETSGIFDLEEVVMEDPAEDPAEDGLATARAALARGAPEDAWEAVSALLNATPWSSGQQTAGEALRSEIEATLQPKYEAELGGLGSTPTLAMTPDQLIWLQLDHRLAFLASQIDGDLSVEDLLYASGMSAFETIRGIAILRRQGAITLSPTG